MYEIGIIGNIYRSYESSASCEGFMYRVVSNIKWVLFLCTYLFIIEKLRKP